MCVRCGTGRIAWCTDPFRHGESTEPVSPGEPPVTGPAAGPAECCELPMLFLDVFGIRIFRCAIREHHPLVFRNLNTGEELQESYDAGDGGLTWKDQT